MRKRSVVLAVAGLAAIAWVWIGSLDTGPNPIRVIVGDEPDAVARAPATPARSAAQAAEAPETLDVRVRRERPTRMKVVAIPVVGGTPGETLPQAEADVVAAETRELRAELDRWVTSAAPPWKIEVTWVEEGFEDSILDTLLRRTTQSCSVVLCARLSRPTR